MKYSDFYKKNTKKSSKNQKKSKKPTILENLKKEINEWSYKPPTQKRWSKSMDGATGLTEFERAGGKDNLNEGPSYEYKRDIKNIDKSYKLHAKSLLDFYEKLRKKGLDNEASELLDSYKKNIITFKKNFDNILRKLM